MVSTFFGYSVQLQEAVQLLEADIGATVLGTAFTGSVVGYRFVLSLALAAYLLRLNALAYHVCLECLGTLLTPYAQVLLGITGVVGMSDDHDTHRSIFRHYLAYLIDDRLLSCLELQVSAACLEVYGNGFAARLDEKIP